MMPIAIVLICWGAAMVGVIAQYAFDVEPCILCTYQRVAYAVAGAVALAALFSKHRALILGGCAAVLLVGAGIAFYHVGVEQHWWASVASCGGAPTTDLSLSDVLAQLNVKQPKPCDEVDWTFLGVSMATYNVGVFLALAVAMARSGIKLRREAAS